MADILPIDRLTIKLLDLLDEYEQLANSSYREDFIDGFLNLSRANFNTAGKIYGVDSFDMSEHSACKTVKFAERWVLVDALREEKQKENKKKELKEKPKHKKSGTNTEKSFTSAKADAKSIEFNQTVEFEPSSLKDPINQFGGLVPYQLREAQTSFNKSLQNCIKVANLQAAINSVMSEIDKEQKKATK